jgi:colanic acid biosynthesis glycosyl transferase WcaI
MRQSFCVATVTHAFVEHFAEDRGIPRSHISFFPNGADTNELRPQDRDEAYARQLGVEGKLVFAYCGTQAHYHGLEVIIDAAAKLKDREDIAILMAGKGPVRAELQERAHSLGLTNVHFVDSPFHEMRKLMSITTASIATVANMKAAAKMRLSKVVPPLACAVPVIYVGEGEFTGILAEHRCGLVVQPASADKLAAAILELANQPQAAAEMGRRGRQYVEQNLSWASIVDRWLDDLRCIQAGKDLWQFRNEPDRYPAAQSPLT